MPDATLPSFEIRRERHGDEPGIFAVHAAAFPTPAEAILVDALRCVGRLTISLVAAREAAIVGHIAFSPVTAPAGDIGLGLAPVAVRPDLQRQGLGGQLIRAGLAECQRLGVPCVVVLGEPAYYARFGFRPARQWGMSDEYGGGDAFQALVFAPDRLARPVGLVRYAPEFAAVA